MIEDVLDEWRRPWAMLPERFHSSHQRAGGHIPAKLWSLEFDVTPLFQANPVAGKLEVRPARDEPLFRTAGELVALPALEHKRRMADRRIDGWRYGKARDNDTHSHPCMIDFDKLDDPVETLVFAILRYLRTLLAALLGTGEGPPLKRQPDSTPISLGSEKEAIALVQRIHVADLLHHG